MRCLKVNIFRIKEITIAQVVTTVIMMSALVTHFFLLYNIDSLQLWMRKIPTNRIVAK